MKQIFPLLLIITSISLSFTNPTLLSDDSFCACKVFVPNAFSPNEDGRNDTFLPFPNCVVADFDMKVFNRWGKLVFESSTADKGWDGKVNGTLLQPDVFVYVIKFTYAEDDQQKEEILSGDVTLLR